MWSNDMFWGIRNTFVGKYHFLVINDHFERPLPKCIADKSPQKFLARVRLPPPSWQCQDFGNIWYTNPSLITWEKLGQVDGLQDLLRPKLLTWRNRLCKGLRSSEEGRFCKEMQWKGWIVQVLYKEGCCLLPWVQVSDWNKTGKPLASL